MKPLPVVLATYEHYKSSEEELFLYQVLFLSRHTETQEVLVNYVPLYASQPVDGIAIYSRPLAMFTELVEIRQGMGRYLVPRFRFRPAQREIDDFPRADGAVICPYCDLPYCRHPYDHAGVVTVLCDGRRIKL
jgi:hypothetical protein